MQVIDSNIYVRPLVGRYSIDKITLKIDIRT